MTDELDLAVQLGALRKLAENRDADELDRRPFDFSAAYARACARRAGCEPTPPRPDDSDPVRRALLEQVGIHVDELGRYRVRPGGGDGVP